MRQQILNTKYTSQPRLHPSPLPLPSQRQFSILIAGAGIGGLIMGLMLERAGIPFLILERDSMIRPMGGAISLCPNVMRALDQLGLMDVLMKESVPIRQIRYYDSMEGAVSVETCDAVTDMSFCETRYGTAIRTIPRSVFINLLLSYIPQHKVLLGKRVIRTQEATLESSLKSDASQSTGYVACYCDDGSDYQGSILVGADGTYSAVRKSMYQNLNESGILDGEENEETMKGGEMGGMTTVDGKVMPHQHCMVGVTQPLDPIEFESLGGEYGEFQALRGADHEHSIWFMPLTNYRIAWNVFFHLPKDLLQEYKDLQSCATTDTNANECTAEEPQFPLPGQHTSRVTTPKPQQTQQQQHIGTSWQSVCKRVHDRAQAALENLRDIPNPLSARQGRFGDLLDKTDSDKISRVMLEQGVVRRWFHGRIVLIGDAAHKSLPYAGQGANQAILDSITLVGKIYLLIRPAVIAGEVAPKTPLVACHPMATRFDMAFPAPRPNKSKLRFRSKHTRPSPITTTPLTINTNWNIPQAAELTQVFQEYYTDRSAIASQATWGASWADTIFGGQGLAASLVRFAFFKLLPTRLFYAVSDPYFEVQPVLPFLPDVTGGTGGEDGRAKRNGTGANLITSVGAGMKKMLGGEWGVFPTLFR